MRRAVLGAALLIAGAASGLGFAPARAWALVTATDDHHLAFAAGYHDLIDGDPKNGVLSLEYRPCCRRYTLRPAVGALIDHQGAFYGYGGIRSELESERRNFMFSINTAIGYYRRGMGTRLGHALEFRSGFEWYYVFANESLLGLTFHHLSNASLGKRNPGTEILSLVYALPFGNQKSR